MGDGDVGKKKENHPVRDEMATPACAMLLRRRQALGHADTPFDLAMKVEKFIVLSLKE